MAEFVLVADVIDSRKKFSKKRWNNLSLKIDELNSTYADGLKTNLMIYSGDSIGCVCKNISTMLQLLFELSECHLLFPMRFLFVEDEVLFGMDKRKFTELEGPALWKIEEGFKEMKKSQLYFLSFLQDKPKDSFILNQTLHLILTLKYSRTETQQKVSDYYRRGNNQQEISKEIGVTQQYISKELKKANYLTISKSQQALLSLYSD